ncbi:DUF2793 domain-containing protein [Pararhodobacter sp.]|uniref:DUF2793 domain-containing protein n=1 Tax=Pararhodobacter sp. TaxID=2127056 RepID=UPI002AFFD7AB|nr:DUF2793 domain-containing protein [Pararhodobacter sp.]
MADYYDTGTISVPINGKTVTGTGTSWANLIRAGDVLEIGGRQMRVASVESATSLTLKLPAPAAASGAYAIWYSAPSRATGLQALDDTRRLIEAFEIVAAMRPEYEVHSATLNAPPASPVTSDMYLISTAPTGAWAGYAGHVARWTGTGWAYVAPQFGVRAVARDTGLRWARSLTAWALSPDLVSALAVSGNLADAIGLLPDVRLPARLGVGATTNVIADNADNILQVQGWGMLNSAVINSPGEFTFTQFWGVQNNGFVIAVHPQSGRAYFRNIGATWQAGWTRLRWTEADLDGRYTPYATGWNGLGSTLFAKLNHPTTGLADYPGTHIYPAQLSATGTPSSNPSPIGSGTWRLVGRSYSTANTDMYTTFRRVL